MKDLVFEGSPDERQMARWIRNLMMYEAVCYPTDRPVRRSRAQVVEYFEQCDLRGISKRELPALIDSAVNANPEVFGREERAGAVYYVTSKRRCFPQAADSGVVHEPPDLTFPQPSLGRTPYQSSQAPKRTDTVAIPPQPRATGTEVVSVAGQDELPPGRGAPQPETTGKRAMPSDRVEGPAPRRAQFTLTYEALSQGWIKVTPGMRKMIRKLGLRPGQGVEFVTYGSYTLHARLNTRQGRFEGPDLRGWFEERRLRVGDRVYVESPERAGQPLRLSSWQDLSRPRPSEGVFPPPRGRLDLRERVYHVLYSEGRIMTVPAIVDTLTRELGRPVGRGSVQSVLLRESHIFAAWGRGHWGLREWGEDWRDRVDPQALLMRIQEDDLTVDILRTSGCWMTERAIAREIGEVLLLPIDVILATSFLDPSDDRLVRHGKKWGLREWQPVTHPWLRALRLYPGFRQVVDEWLLSWSNQTSEELLTGP